MDTSPRKTTIWTHTPTYRTLAGLHEKAAESSRGLLWQFFKKEVACIQWMAANIACLGPPQPDRSTGFLVPFTKRALTAPKCKDRTNDAAARSTIRLIMLAVQCGSGPVLFTDGVNGRSIAQRSNVGFPYLVPKHLRRRPPAVKYILNDCIRSCRKEALGQRLGRITAQECREAGDVSLLLANIEQMP